MKVAIILDIMPSYREGFYDILFEREDMEVTVYAQTKIPGMNLKTIHNRYPTHVKLVKFISAKREIIAWQFLPFYKLFTEYDVVVVHGNPRQISHFLLATFLRLFGKKVVLWAMAHSFRGFSPTENLRLFWYRIFKFIFVYTDAEVEFLRKNGFNKQYIVGMNNGLNQRKIDAAILEWNADRLEKWRKMNGLEDKVLLLSCARLDTKNKFELIIHALPTMVAKYPNLIWCVIGSGVEEKNLQTLVKEKGFVSHVRFVGEIYDETDLAPWFLSSELFIHPAAIGLSLMHAFGYGLPVVTHGNARLHNPEYAAFEPNLTGCNFHEGDIKDLSKTIINLLYDSDARIRMKGYVYKVAKEKYNVDIMVERFVQIVQKASIS